MTDQVVVETARAELVAAVRTSVRIGDVGRAWKPALDEVWAFLRAHTELRPGHNPFHYYPPSRRDGAMSVDFGVQIAYPFDRQGNVRCVEAPVAELASPVHIGAYNRLAEAHHAIRAGCATHGRKIVPESWETYGDSNDDPAMLVTTSRYLLA
jgi:hypothetical protein